MIDNIPQIIKRRSFSNELRGDEIPPLHMKEKKSAYS